MTHAITLDCPPEALGPAELQAAARDAYRQALAHGPAPTGAELGHRFGRSDRWGRDRIAEARAEDDATATRAAATAAAPANNGNDPAAADSPTAASGGHPVSTTEESGSRNGVSAAADAGGPAADIPVAAADTAQPIDGSPKSDLAEPWSRRVIRWVTTAAVIIVAGCAARSSYEHQRTLIEMAGEHDSAWYLPLSVDGLVLIASLNMLVRRWEGQPAGWLTWTALLLGGAASLAANIAAAEPTVTGRLVAAWSPICLTISYELLMQQLPTRERHSPGVPGAERGVVAADL